MNNNIKNKLKLSKFFPKIPVEVVFSNNNIYSNGYSNKMDDIFKIPYEYIENDKFETLPNEIVDVKKIIPTQKFLNFNNLTKAKPKHETGAYLVKYKDNYYVLDGHHRIAYDILDGETHTIAHVYDTDKENLTMEVRVIVREILREKFNH